MTEKLERKNNAIIEKLKSFGVQQEIIDYLLKKGEISYIQIEGNVCYVSYSRPITIIFKTLKRKYPEYPEMWKREYNKLIVFKSSYREITSNGEQKVGSRYQIYVPLDEEVEHYHDQNNEDDPTINISPVIKSD